MNGSATIQEASLSGTITSYGILSGTIKTNGNLSGRILLNTDYQEASLRGTITSYGTLSGTIKASGNLSGRVLLNAEYQDYVGVYDVAPKIEPQVLETADKHMTKNVTVQAIPYYEVTNAHGGTTVIIGGIYNGIE